MSETSGSDDEELATCARPGVTEIRAEGRRAFREQTIFLCVVSVVALTMGSALSYIVATAMTNCIAG